MSSPTRRRARYIVLATAVLGLAGAGIASAQTTPHARRAPAHPGTLAGAVTATQPASWSRTHRPRPTRSPGATPTPTAPAPEPTATPTPTESDPTTPAPTPPAPTPPVPTPPAPTTPAPSTDPVVDQVLAHINAARVQNGLSPLALSADLSRASALHTQLMIGGCGLSHQCPGEAGLGERFTAQGVHWTSAGENIGYGSAGSSEAAIVGAANGLTDSMLAEVAPNDGHRRNLLNSGFRFIGLSVVRDSKGLVWMTQDFVN